METKGYYVYFYYQNDEIIYIGKTINIKKRHQQHMLENKFIINPYTHISILPCQTEIDMDILEKYFISLYHPKLNIKDTDKGITTLSILQQIPDKINKNDFEDILSEIDNSNTHNKTIKYNFILSPMYTPIDNGQLQNKIINKECNFTIDPNNWTNYNLSYSQFRLLFWLIFIYQLNNNHNRFPACFQFFNEAANLSGHGGGAIYNRNLSGIQVLKDLKLLDNNSNSSCIIFTQKMIDLCNNLTNKLTIEFCSFFSKTDTQKTKYSTKLFLILIADNHSSVYYPIDELKSIFNINEIKTSEFNRHILYPTIQELNNKLTLKITVQLVKQGPKIIGYNFIINEGAIKNDK